VVSGSLASPTPTGGGDATEQGNKEDETESRSDLQGAGGVGRGQRGQYGGGIGQAISCTSHPDHRYEL
jgi:hypothetical protein